MNKAQATEYFKKAVRSLNGFFIPDEVLQQKMDQVINALEKIEITSKTNEKLLVVPVIPTGLWPLKNQLENAEICYNEIKLNCIHDNMTTSAEPYFLIGVEVKNQKDCDLTIVTDRNKKNNLLELTLVEAISILRVCPLQYLSSHGLYTPGTEYELVDEVMCLYSGDKIELSSSPCSWCGPVLIPMEVVTALQKI